MESLFQASEKVWHREGPRWKREKERLWEEEIIFSKLPKEIEQGQYWIWYWNEMEIISTCNEFGKYR